MSKQIIRVIETRVYEYRPIDQETGEIESWYNEDGRTATTIAECMEHDRKQAEAMDSDEYVGPEEYATEKNLRAYQYNLVTVPDDYDYTDPTAAV